MGGMFDIISGTGDHSVAFQTIIFCLLCHSRQRPALYQSALVLLQYEQSGPNWQASQSPSVEEHKQTKYHLTWVDVISEA